MKDFVQRAIRVLRVATRPSEEEYAEAVKITGAGILFIGGLGFTVSLLFKVI